MANTYVITTNTQDELDGITVRFVNVYEREERPGVQTVELILDDGSKVLAVGDQFTFATKTYRLTDITRTEAGFFDVSVIEVNAPLSLREKAKLNPRPKLHLDRPQTAAALRDIYLELTPEVLRTMGAPKGIGISEWQVMTTEEMHADWNGAKMGPSRDWVHIAAFEGEVEDCEAEVHYSDIRFSPDEPYRFEVRALWRVGQSRISLFSMEEAPDLVDVIYGLDGSSELAALIVSSIKSG